MNTNNSKEEIAEWKSSFTKIFHELTDGEAQEKLAEKIGVSRPTIAAWLNGTKHPDVTFLCKIANAYGVSVDYLLGRSKSRALECNQTSEEVLREFLAICKMLNLKGFVGSANKGKYNPEGDYYYAVATSNRIFFDFMQDYLKIEKLLIDETYPDYIKEKLKDCVIEKYKDHSLEEMSENAFNGIW